MTTDPGAVPPDATPLPTPEEMAALIKGDEEKGIGAASATAANVPGAAGVGNGNNAGNGASVVLSGAAAVAGAGVALAGASVVVAGAAAAAAVSASMPSKPAKQSAAGEYAAGAMLTSRRELIIAVCVNDANQDGPPLPLGEQLCRHWESQVLFALHILYVSFLHIFYDPGDMEIHSMYWYAFSAQPLLDEPTHILNLIGLMVEALLFGLFTCCMMIDQWDVVMTNVTHIDRLKGETGFSFLDDQRRKDVNEVFGTGRGSTSHFRPDWMSPFVRVCFPSSLQDEIMGFCRPCGLGTASSTKKDDDDIELGRKSRVARSVPDIV
eukprot:CAMPEP_0113567234 /NCGR_PEP_ID=MMETSP0015_2-20120614/23158_1 /TAXON_ID=2838 /ORGANISM="Odontella" /LENGTH=322 /DNA_ID=CAMNT_0000469597 /DNA_START=583 /DNA_END=1554 /DNA_ORIENTATION=- /assembly_acc=CAM_ASM_000160